MAVATKSIGLKGEGTPLSDQCLIKSLKNAIGYSLAINDTRTDGWESQEPLSCKYGFVAPLLLFYSTALASGQYLHAIEVPFTAARGVERGRRNASVDHACHQAREEVGGVYLAHVPVQPHLRSATFQGDRFLWVSECQ